MFGIYNNRVDFRKGKHLIIAGLILFPSLFQTSFEVNDNNLPEENFPILVQSRSEDGKYLAVISGIKKEVKIATLDNKKVKTKNVEATNPEIKPWLSVVERQDGKTIRRLPALKLNTYDSPVLNFWPVEFHDLDGDGIPEIWVRFTILLAVDYAQILQIYKIKNGHLKLLKEFFAPSGMTKRIGKRRVKVIIWAVSDKPGVSHLNFDLYRIEIWEYKNGDFVKISEKRIPRQKINFQELMR